MTKNEKRSWHKMEFKVIIKGVANWIKIMYLWNNGTEFYRLEKDPDSIGKRPDRDIYRREYFFRKLKREYRGWRNCFEEFCEALEEICVKENRFPSGKDFDLAVEKLGGLDPDVKKLYVNYYREFFSKTKRSP